MVDELVERLGRGGRLVLVGAGSSGRLAQAEAAECEATFSTRPGQVVALVAGADAHSSLEREAAEDDEDAGRRALAALSPFVLGAAWAAGGAGAFTACVVSVPESELAEYSDVTISAVVGPELLAGSTRLKAGTAQKLILNTLSTVTMIRLGKTYAGLMVDVVPANEKNAVLSVHGLGKTYAGLMVDVVPANEKLRARVRRIVAEATGASDEDVERALVDAGGEAKVAIVSLLADVDTETARTRLAAAGGNVRLALLG